MNVIEHLEKRGFIDQKSSEELNKLADKPMKVYVGFDPTADSLHLGNFVGIMALLWFQKFGHTPYILLGGATGRIGDPSGKSVERPLLQEEEIQKNLACLDTFFKQFFEPFKGSKPIIVNNDTWFSKFSFIEFLRDVGKHFRMGPMLSKESVKQRLSQKEGMSFTEFSYQMIQGYDFYHLHETDQVSLQMGGSDQWGNITAGIEYTRKRSSKTVYGLTHPLLTRSDGKKFGKSEGGAIWLDERKLSPYQFYQYLFSIPDADVCKLMRLLTFMELEEIEKIEKLMGTNGYIANSAQKRLAEEVTRIVHGEEGLQKALKVTEGAGPGKDTVLTKEVLEEIAKDMPHQSLDKKQVINSTITDVAVLIKLVNSKTEMRKLIQNGGAYLNNIRIEDPSYTLEEKDLVDNSYLLFSAGKKKKILVSVS